MSRENRRAEKRVHSRKDAFAIREEIVHFFFFFFSRSGKVDSLIYFWIGLSNEAFVYGGGIPWYELHCRRWVFSENCSLGEKLPMGGFWSVQGKKMIKL